MKKGNIRDEKTGVFAVEEFGNLKGDPVTIVECIEIADRFIHQKDISYEGLEKMQKKFIVHRDIL